MTVVTTSGFNCIGGPYVCHPHTGTWATGWCLSKNEYGMEAGDEASRKASIRLTFPKKTTGKQIHLICEVTDKGTPALTSYRRAVVTIEQATRPCEPPREATHGLVMRNQSNEMVTGVSFPVSTLSVLPVEMACISFNCWLVRRKVGLFSTIEITSSLSRSSGLNR